MTDEPQPAAEENRCQLCDRRCGALVICSRCKPDTGCGLCGAEGDHDCVEGKVIDAMATDTMGQPYSYGVHVTPGLPCLRCGSTPEHSHVCKDGTDMHCFPVFRGPLKERPTAEPYQCSHKWRTVCVLCNERAEHGEQPPEPTDNRVSTSYDGPSDDGPVLPEWARTDKHPTPSVEEAAREACFRTDREHASLADGKCRECDRLSTFAQAQVDAAVKAERGAWRRCFWRDVDGKWAVNLSAAIWLLERKP